MVCGTRVHCMHPTSDIQYVQLTNDYSQRIWPKSKQSMVLKGAIRDRIHAKQFLDRFMPGIRVEEINNALCQSIVRHVARVCPPLVVAYFQGHSGDDTSLLRYITGDRNEDSTLEGFTAEIITDFCNSGNIHRLRFRLIVLPGGGSYWRETQEWSHDNAVNPKYRITSPMVHISASLDSQSAYETGERGGFLTDSLAKAPSKILPEFLSHLRQGVGHNLKDAKVHPRRPLDQSAAQLPQIYCTCKLVSRFVKHALTRKMTPFVPAAARRPRDFLKDLFWNAQTVLVSF
ncbi:hypothetical protein B0J17DRAFT_686976 [Rhizoctonia solani]|nr:hypothetical protein B0J17DRAFT_686976 [Rhizoctonia solani]